MAAVAVGGCSRESEQPIESRSAQDLYLEAERELADGNELRAGRHGQKQEKR